MSRWLLLITICCSFYSCSFQSHHPPCDWEIFVIEDAPEESLQSESFQALALSATTVQPLHPNSTSAETERILQANTPTEHPLSQYQDHLESAKRLQDNTTTTTTTTTTEHSVPPHPEKSGGSFTANHSIHDFSNTNYTTARVYVQLLSADHITNISGLIFQRPDLSVFRLQLQLELRCSGATQRQRLLRRLLAQRQLPELSVSGDSATAGPTELLLQALPVLPAGRRQHSRDAYYVAPLPLLAPRLTIQTIRTPSVAASRRQINFVSQRGEGGDGADGGEDPPPAALDLSCLGARARSSISHSQATRLSHLQRVRLRPPLYMNPAPTDDDPWPGETPPPAVLAGYRYLVQLVQTKFLEREQQQNATYDQLVSPMQRMRERALLVDGAARFFYFSQPDSVYVPPDSYEKLVPEPDGAGIRALPPALYLDHREQLQFSFTVPRSVSPRLVAEPAGLLRTGVNCHAAADGWRRCMGTVRPLPTAPDTQHRPATGLRWATVSLNVPHDTGRGKSAARDKDGGRGSNDVGEDECERHPPAPLRVAVGCPPSTTLLFNFTSTFQAAGLAEKCPRCLCDHGVPCLLYSDVFQPQLVLVDWTTYQSRNFTGNYTVTVLGAGYRADLVPNDGDERQHSLADRIWAPSISDETAHVPQELFHNPVFPNPLLNGIKWRCDQYSACPPFVRLRFSNADVDSGTFCRYELDLVVHLYGAPTNTFVDVVTMSAVFGVTMIVSLLYTSALAVQKQRVKPERSRIKDLYTAQDQR